MSNKNIYRPQSKFQYSSYLYIVPAFVFYILFVLFPLGDTLYTSFTEWNGISEKKWVGLDQYIKNLSDKKITSSIKHSFILIIFYSFLPIIIGLLIAGLMIRVKIRGMTTYRAILFLPQILSMIVVGISWRWIYAPKGPLNAGLDFFGLEDVSELYDAAKVDGAGAISEFFNVTLPNLRGEIIVALIFTVTLALRNFDLIYITTGGGPGTSTMIPSMFIYKKAFQMGQVGSASSLGIMLTLMIFTLVSLILITFRERK